jgi:hypothetical protein
MWVGGWVGGGWVGGWGWVGVVTLWGRGGRGVSEGGDWKEHEVVKICRTYGQVEDVFSIPGKCSTD